MSVIPSAEVTAASDRSHIRGLLRDIAVSGMAGIPAGLLVGGLGGRLFMRVAGAVAPDRVHGLNTEAGFSVGEVTLGGTIALVLFVGLFTGIVGGAFYVLLSPWLAWAGRLRGIAFGLVLFGIVSAPSDVMNPDNPDFALVKSPVLMVVMIVMIVALFVAFGVSIEGFRRWLDRRLPSPAAGRSPAVWAFAVIAILGAILGLLALPQALFGTDFCDCDPPRIASSFVVIVAAATMFTWYAERDPDRSGPLRAARLGGYLGLVGAATFGLWRAISDAVEIIAG